MKHTIVTIAATIASVAGIGIALVSIIDEGIAKIEHHECLRWQSQEQHYMDFYSPSWAKEQCSRFNISLK